MSEAERETYSRLPAVAKLMVFLDLAQEVTRDAGALGSLMNPERQGRAYLAHRWPRDHEALRERLLQDWLSFLALPGNNFRDKAVSYLAPVAANPAGANGD